MSTFTFKNGDIVPKIGLGTWLSKPNEVYNAVLAAIKAGYRHFDCAFIYQNETEIGRAFRFAFDNGLVKREDIFVTSKLWNSDHAPEKVETAFRKSIAYLQLVYLDLYLFHWPVAFKTGHEYAHCAADLVSPDELPIEKTWQVMEIIQEKGLAKHIGVSNFNIPKLNRLLTNSRVAPEMLQVELHPYFQQAELIEFCRKNKILVTAYSPLGSHHLIQGKAGLTHEAIVKSIAEKHHCTPAQVLLAWGMQRGTIVIPKSVNEKRIRENYEALNVEIDATDFVKFGDLEQNLRISKGLFCVLPGGFYTYEDIWDK
jgi:alcohol dehydrogenase (NADP+)